MKHGIMVGGGTHALYTAYKAHGIGEGDEVITTSHTFIATIDQIHALGATPILIDIGEDGLINPDLIEGAITFKTKAIVPVHLEGKNCDMKRIIEIAEKHNLLVIEDAAQAVGSDLWTENTKCFSMFPAKILGSTGNAGMVLTNNDKVAEIARMLRCNYGIGKNQDINAGWGMQLEPDAIQAAVLNIKMKYLDERIARRKEIAERYYKELEGLPITLPVKQEGRVYQDFVIRVEDPKKFKEYMLENGVATLGSGLIPNHLYPNLGLYFDLPKTVDYLAHQIRIPCNPDLTDEEVTHIINTIKDYYA
jgi:dTDP-4-amino-4,6-dideoxygalactose transaminase